MYMRGDGYTDLISLDKADLKEEREVDNDQAEKLAALWGCTHYETSAVSPCPLLSDHIVPENHVTSVYVYEPSEVGRADRT